MLTDIDALTKTDDQERTVTLTRDQLAAELKDAIATNSGLPTHWYNAEEVLQLEQELIFRKSWYHVGHLDQLANVGDFVTATIAGASVLLTRTEDGIRGYFNTCRHRGHLVKSEPQGNAKSLLCRYHGWNYDLDGSLRSAPYAQDEVGFDKCMFSLTPIKVDYWGPLVFANLDVNAPAFMELFHELPTQAAKEGWHMGEGFRRVPREPYTIEANWKLVVDNSIECTHCTLTHPNFARTYNVKMPVYEYHEFENYSYQWGPAQVEQRVGNYQQWFLFPHTLPVRAGGIVYDFWTFEPLSATKTLASGVHYFHESVTDAEIEAYYEGYSTITQEDQAVMENMQRGLNPAYSGPANRNLVKGGERLLQHMQSLMLNSFENA
ncbi:aromatic ring-hydroxylating oxygenase subunit alpha [Nocardioides glacieisoli]|uniref:aromatic ring-hydroxylating oxygenase subunit alpha n=1 Tax=Nocardioides glacieisoli TaxID=1168730 RepID=UPI0013EC4578|nr:aromatic ring-hydroxylating dioxygenase subunit alpha [Nocardioides glacieisoli]